MNTIINVLSGFDQAIAMLRNGRLVAVPTETVYGLAADATNTSAVNRIYEAKGRPDFNPLIAHVAGLDMAEKYGAFDDHSRQLAMEFWPGPLTLVLPLKPQSNIAKPVTAGLETIALRHPRGIMAKLSAGLGTPVAAPSANSSGHLSPTLATHVQADLGDKVDLILDGGPCELGLESTIVRCSDGQVTLLREGGLPVEDLEKSLGFAVQRGTNNPKVEAPGMLLAHYAPRKPVRLNATSVSSEDALLSFGHQSTEGQPVAHLNLSENGDLTEAAHNLFAMLKMLDESGAVSIAVQAIPHHGLGAAINDRLRRAAHGRTGKGELAR